jgi:hypothetical protein
MHRQELFGLPTTGTAKLNLQVSLAEADDFASELAIAPVKQYKRMSWLCPQNLAQIVSVILTQSQ